MPAPRLPPARPPIAAPGAPRIPPIPPPTPPPSAVIFWGHANYFRAICLVIIRVLKLPPPIAPPCPPASAPPTPPPIYQRVLYIFKNYAYYITFELVFRFFRVC